MTPLMLHYILDNIARFNQFPPQLLCLSKQHTAVFRYWINSFYKIKWANDSVIHS